MTLSKDIRKPEFLNTVAQYEFVENFGGSRSGEMIRRHRTLSADELLIGSLPGVLAALGTKPLRAWLVHFMRTEP